MDDENDPLVTPLQPWEHPYWESALADLEENHPDRLHELLTASKLEEYLTAQVERAVAVKIRLNGNPDLDDAERDLMAVQAIVTEADPNAPPAKELTPETKKLLERFNQMLMERPSLPQVRLSEL